MHTDSSAAGKNFERTTGAATDSAPVVRFDAASFSYGHGSNRVTVLEGIDGSLHRGEALALIGPNGAGKSTVLKGLVGIVDSSQLHLASGAIGYVPQTAEFDPTFPVTARDVVAMGIRGAKKNRWWWPSFLQPNPAKDPRTMAALQRVGLADRANYRFGQLSGGQRQRVLIARALVSQPMLMLLDEPFNGLDDPNRKALLAILSEIKKEGVAIVVSTHDLVLAEETCDKVLLLAGRQVAFGPINDVLQPDVIAQAYGGHHAH